MNEEHFNEWLEALESGNYEQGFNCLATAVEGGMTFCCLGVGEEVAGIDYDEGQALPTIDFIDWLGIPLRKGLDRSTIEPDTEMGIGLYFGDGENLRSGRESNFISVATLNDGSGGQEPHTFPEIVVWLREHKDQLVAL